MADMSKTATVTLGGKSVDLRIPKSYSARADCVLISRDNIRRAWGAALGLAWSPVSDGNPNRDVAPYDGRPLAYGGAVWDVLAERGIPDWEIQEAGAIAYDLITDGLVFRREVKRALGNSETPAPGDGASTAQSP